MLRHGELAGSWASTSATPTARCRASMRRETGITGSTRAGAIPATCPHGFTGPARPPRTSRRARRHGPSAVARVRALSRDRRSVLRRRNRVLGELLPASAPSRPTTTGKGAQGLLIGNEVRGIGWGLRNLGDAAAYLPDSSPMKAYLAAKVVEQPHLLDNYARHVPVRAGADVVSRPPAGRRPAQYQPYMWISLWEQSYLAWAVDRVMQHGSVAPHNFANAGATIRNRIARLQLESLHEPAVAEGSQRQAPYILAAGKWATAEQHAEVPSRHSRRWPTATFSVPTPARPDFPRPFQGYYGPEARLLLMICEEARGRGAARAASPLDGRRLREREMRGRSQ